MARTKQPEIIKEYVKDGVKYTVYAEKKAKRVPWQKNDTFYGAKMRIEDDTMFASFSRKAGKA